MRIGLFNALALFSLRGVLHGSNLIYKTWIIQQNR